MGQETANCKTCRKDFLFYRSTLRGKDASFCSRKCIKLVPHNRGVIELKKCECGQAIRKWKKYCGKSCFNKYSDPVSHLGKYAKGLQGKDNPFYGKHEYSGKDHWNWKGGITPINQKIRNSKDYILWRTAVFMRDDYTCQICDERGGNLQADHIKPFSLYPELRLAIDNGRTLCKSCHLQTDTWGGRVYKFLEGELN